jgi:multidrug efflux pump
MAKDDNANELFESAPVPHAFFTLTMPVVFSMVVSLICNLTDTFFIAQTGDANIVAGISLGGPVFTLMMAIGDVFGLGGSSVISRLLGQGKDEDVRRISAFCFWASLVVGVVVTILMLVFRDFALTILGADASTWEHASAYYTGIAIGAPLIITSLTPGNQLRTEGLAKESMAGGVSGVLVNLVLDPIFINVMGWGAAGAVSATVIGYVFSLGVYVWLTATRATKLSVDPRKASCTLSELGALLAIGIPASITNLMQTICSALTNNCLAVYGATAVAAMGIAGKGGMITTLVLAGFTFGSQPLVGYNYGSGDKKRLREVLKFCFGFQTALALVLSLGVAVFAEQLVNVFMGNPDVATLAVPMMRLQQVSMVAAVTVMGATCVFQSVGDAVSAGFLSISRQGVVFIVVILVLSALFGLQGIMVSQVVSDIVTCAIALALLARLFRRELS